MSEARGARGYRPPSHGLTDHERLRLLSFVTRRPTSELRGSANLTEAEADRFTDLVGRRRAGEPLQYLEGTVSFGPIELAVDARVLIPRPETEYLFGLLSRRPVAPALIVDVCTGSGALALALRWRFPSARVIGTDVSAEALTVAGANGATLGLEVEWLLSDLLDALPVDLKGTVDLLVANPPYVAEAEWPRLPPDVRHEPYQALVAGPDGTELIRRLLATLPRWMAEGGEGWIEIGETQGPRLVDEFEVEIVDDQYERNRFLRWRA